MRIALDCDGVLANFAQAYLNELGLQHTHRYEDIRSVGIPESFGLGPEADLQVETAVRERAFCARIPPYPGALDFVQSLQEKHEVIACTSPWTPDWIPQRAIWLEEVVGIPLRKQVHRWDKQNERADLLIDDNTQNCISFGSRNGGLLRPANQFPKAFLFAQPWNAEKDTALLTPYSVRRVANYSEVLSLLGCRQILHTLDSTYPRK